MEDGAWIEMIKSFKKIFLAILLLPFLASPIKEAEENLHQQIRQNIIQKELSAINYEAIYSNSGSEIPVLSDYEKYYEKISPLIGYLEEKGFQGFQLNCLLQSPKFEIYENPEKKFKNSAEEKSSTLEEYKEALGYEDKKNNISDFINKNIEQLEFAEKTYDVSKYINSAIIGVESDFGNNLGRFNPFNAYFSMYAGNYKKEFAKAQLEELLIFCEKKNVDVFSLKSSHAGAILYIQFIPSSLNRWFIGDDLYDMGNNILSAANYLSHFREKTGSLEKAIFKYNKSGLFVRTVLDLAKDAEKLWTCRESNTELIQARDVFYH